MRVVLCKSHCCVKHTFHHKSTRRTVPDNVETPAVRTTRRVSHQNVFHVHELVFVDLSAPGVHKSAAIMFNQMNVVQFGWSPIPRHVFLIIGWSCWDISSQVTATSVPPGPTHHVVCMFCIQQLR